MNNKFTTTNSFFAYVSILLLLFVASACNTPDTTNGNLADATIPDGSTFMDGQIVEIDAGVLDLGSLPDLGHDSGVIVIVPPCGNGTYNTGEQCDDRNTVSGDGCSSTCKVELNWHCGTGIPSTCLRDWFCTLPQSATCAGNNLGTAFVGNLQPVVDALNASNTGTWVLSVDGTYVGHNNAPDPQQICQLINTATDPTNLNIPAYCVQLP